MHSASHLQACGLTMHTVQAFVVREYREYERSVTTLVDAAVKPKVGAYVTNIRTRLDEIAPGVPFYVMKSNGGVLSAGEVVHEPITTMLSGPTVGALGAALIAGTAGFDRVLACDGGGTSTDVTVVIDGEPALTTEGSVGDYASKIPMIDVVTVGAGGSIAWLSPEGTLKVGPTSAGADPGPIRYPHGGDQPTATDAHVVLGGSPRTCSAARSRCPSRGSGRQGLRRPSRARRRLLLPSLPSLFASDEDAAVRRCRREGPVTTTAIATGPRVGSPSKPGMSTKRLVSERPASARGRSVWKGELLASWVVKDPPPRRVVGHQLRCASSGP